MLGNGINLRYQLIAAILITMIIILFSGRRKLHIARERAFAAMIAAVLSTIVLDVASVLCMGLPGQIPLPVMDIIRRAYLISIVVVAFCMLLYTLAEVFQTSAFVEAWRYSYTIPLAISLPLISYLPISTGQGETYAFSWAVFVSMGTTVIYMIISVMYGLKYFKRLTVHRRNAIFFAAVAVFSAGLIQLKYQDVRLMSLGCSILIIYMYMGLETPDIYVDKLLDTFNRDAFYMYLKNQCSEKKRLSLLYVLVREFEEVRELTGINISNRLLMGAANYLQSIKGAQVFRMGDMSFIVSFEKPEHFMEHVQAVRERFAQSWAIKDEDDDRDLELEMKAYVIAYPAVRMPVNLDAEDIVDTLRYFEEKISRNESMSYVCIDRREIREKQAVNHVKSVISGDVNEDTIEVFYQPIFSVKDNRCHGIEALMRLRDERGIFFDNSVVLSVTERSGEIINIGYSVFKKICSFVATHDLKSIGIERVGVNLSMVQCQQRNLGKRFIEIMESYNVPASMFTFEVSENTAAYMTQSLRRNMNQLMAQGASFIIDNYGLGLIDSDKVTQVSKNYIKLGEHAVRSYFDGSKSKQSVKIMSRTLQDLKFTVAAVGVETQEEYIELKRLGITYMQGNAFYRPMDGETLMETLEKETAVGLGQEVLFERVL